MSALHRRCPARAHTPAAWPLAGQGSGQDGQGSKRADVEGSARSAARCRGACHQRVPVPELVDAQVREGGDAVHEERKSTRLNSSHGYISYAVFCLKKKKKKQKKV